jgi:hypothetical protein
VQKEFFECAVWCCNTGKAELKVLDSCCLRRHVCTQDGMVLARNRVEDRDHEFYMLIAFHKWLSSIIIDEFGDTATDLIYACGFWKNKLSWRSFDWCRGAHHEAGEGQEDVRLKHG